MHKIKTYFIIHIYKFLNILLLGALLIGVYSFQPLKAMLEIEMKGETQKIQTNGFEISEIKDYSGISNIGQILTKDNRTAYLTLAKGVAPAIKRYLAESYIALPKSKLIRVAIKKIKFNEITIDNKYIEGTLEVKLVYDLIIGDDLYASLTQHATALRYTRLKDQTNVLAQYLSMGIKSNVQFFNERMEKNKDSNPVLANSVKLKFKEYQEQTEGDSIYYSKKRPLKWDDFKDKIYHGIYSAEVIPGLGFAESNSVKDGQLLITLQMKVYLPKSAAYVRPGEENEYNLNHEQRHFDIVKIVSERFKKRMLAEKLPVYNYDGYINVAYFDALREIASIQKLYDLDTRHGSDFVQQLFWNKKIDLELKEND